MEAKEEVRSRLNIEDVIGSYVQLKRAGRNFKGLSPFSQEKTPSFMVSPDKQIWHDFSSGRGGDVFSFVMEMEGVDFKGALELLARKAGVDLGQFRNSDGQFNKKKQRLYEVCDLATRFYQQVLLRREEAQSYVKKRGLNQKTVEDFRLGFSPSHDELLAALKKRGFTEQELRDAGLVVTRRFGASDMFRGRFMVSLMDAHGRPVGFTARLIRDEPNAPKYINTPQTLLYDKSRHVFGLHLAKEAIRQADTAVIVEGNMDVISSHQAGVKNVVATAGTALTEHHLRTLGRFTQDVRLCFDADKAGIAATERAIAIASNLGINLAIVVLPGDAKDPDELIQKDVSLWREAIAKPQDAVWWLLNIYADRFDLSTATGKRLATDRALEVVRNIQDPVLIEHYLRMIAERVNTSWQSLNTKLQRQETQSKPVVKKVEPKNPSAPDKFAYQDHLLALTLVYPQIRDVFNKLEPEEFVGDIRKKIAESLKISQDTNTLQTDDIRVKINELEFIAQAKYPSLSDELYFIASDIAKRIKKDYKQKKRSELAKLFAQADDMQTRQQLNNQIKQLDKEIEALKR